MGGMSEQLNRNESSVRLRRGAKALIRSTDGVLLVKERHADGSEFWTFPGGGLKSRETPSTALHRELAEELRCRASIEMPLTEFWYAHTSSPNKLTRCTVFECELLSEAVPNSVEGIYEKRWVRPGKLPPSTLLQVRYTIENHVS